MKPLLRAPLLAMSLVGLTLVAQPARAQNLGAPPSLKRIPIPEPAGLGQFVKSKAAAIALGKALFWDMQVGSDAVQACASCHYHAGADTRARNAVNPGLNAGDTTFQLVGPGGTLLPVMFPLTTFQNPADNSSPMTRSTNDVVSSPGVHDTTWVGQPSNGADEQGVVVPDPVFSASGYNTRRVPGRNAPTVINAVFNVNNFWDGRADSVFNGSSPFGDADPNAGIWMPDANGNLVKQRVRIPFSSLASQAVGPPGNPVEMSYAGRTFPDIGRKLLDSKIVPLGLQNVHPLDSVLGPLARSGFKKIGKTTRLVMSTGLATTYAAMITAAFNDQYWNSTQLVQPLLPARPDTFTQMEANFSLFFGLAVQCYEATLVSDDSPFDRFMDGDPAAMSASAQEGLNIFISSNVAPPEVGVGGNCIGCHGTSTFSNASVMHVGTTNFGASLPEGLIERMIMGDFGGAFYDAGYYDIGIRPIDEDLGRGGTTPFTFPDGTPIPLSFTDRAMYQFNGGFVPFATPPLPCGPGFLLVCPSDQRVATRGVFKVPTLRNVELTGPYMHNGGEATLMQVLDFYCRGGNFGVTNLSTFDPEIQILFGLNPTFIVGDPATAEANQQKVIDFLLALTDERVRWEKAPFDHPELLIADGSKLKSCGKQGQDCDNFTRLPAVGAGGLAAEGLPAIGTFLGLNPKQQ